MDSDEPYMLPASAAQRNVLDGRAAGGRNSARGSRRLQSGSSLPGSAASDAAIDAPRRKQSPGGIRSSFRQTPSVGDERDGPTSTTTAAQGETANGDRISGNGGCSTAAGAVETVAGGGDRPESADSLDSIPQLKDIGKSLKNWNLMEKEDGGGDNGRPSKVASDSVTIAPSTATAPTHDSSGAGEGATEPPHKVVSATAKVFADHRRGSGLQSSAAASAYSSGAEVNSPEVLSPATSATTDSQPVRGMYSRRQGDSHLQKLFPRHGEDDEKSGGAGRGAASSGGENIPSQSSSPTRVPSTVGAGSSNSGGMSRASSFGIINGSAPVMPRSGVSRIVDDDSGSNGGSGSGGGRLLSVGKFRNRRGRHGGEGGGDGRSSGNTSVVFSSDVTVATAATAANNSNTPTPTGEVAVGPGEKMDGGRRSVASSLRSNGPGDYRTRVMGDGKQALSQRSVTCVTCYFSPPSGYFFYFVVIFFSAVYTSMTLAVVPEVQ